MVGFVFVELSRSRSSNSARLRAIERAVNEDHCITCLKHWNRFEGLSSVILVLRYFSSARLSFSQISRVFRYWQEDSQPPWYGSVILIESVYHAPRTNVTMGIVSWGYGQLDSTVTCMWTGDSAVVVREPWCVESTEREDKDLAWRGCRRLVFKVAGATAEYNLRPPTTITFSTGWISSPLTL